MVLMDFGLIIGGGYAISLLLERTGITDYLYNSLQGHTNVSNSEYELLIGYSGKLLKRQIKVDFKVFPSLSITGISNCGKSKMVEYIMQNSLMDKVLINAYKDDFKGVKCRRITNIEKIEKYLDYLLEERKAEEPLLLIFDECLTLMSYKNIAKKLHTLLTKNRHMNVYVICIFQELNKTIVPFKSLFTARVVMRQIQASDVNSALGTTLEEYKPLQNREFILLSDDLYRGKTYDV